MTAIRTSRAAGSFALHARMPWPLLAAASLAMFTVAASGTTRAPFLIEMARDLSANVPLIADLVAISSISWGITSVIAGAGSDRWGTRPFLLGGPLGLAVATTGIATGGSFAAVAAWVTLAGAFCGLFSGVIFAEVSARVSPTQQGRALGWVMSGQSLTLLIGVPLAAWVGSWIGWRGVNVCIAALALITAASLLATTARRANVGSGCIGASAVDACSTVAAGAATARHGDRRANLLRAGGSVPCDIPAIDLLTVAPRGGAAIGHFRDRQHSWHTAGRPAGRPIAQSSGHFRLGDVGVRRCRARPVRLANECADLGRRWASATCSAMRSHGLR